MKRDYVIENIGTIDCHTWNNNFAFAIEDYARKGSQSHSKDRICCVGEIHLAGCVYHAFHLAGGIYSTPSSVT